MVRNKSRENSRRITRKYKTDKIKTTLTNEREKFTKRVLSV
jgi:hypothetical protein